MHETESFPGDRRAAAFSYAAGVVGIVTFAALALFYALEVSRPDPHLFGPASDIGSALFSLLVIPVIAQFHKRLPRSAAAQTALAAVVVLSIAGAIGSLLLVAKVLDFSVATTAAMLALAAQALWLLLAHIILLKRNGYPRRLAKFGRFVGAAFLVGAAIVALGLLVPAGWMQWVVFGIGGVIGLAGWIGMPFWYFMAARRLTDAGLDRPHQHVARV